MPTKSLGTLTLDLVARTAGFTRGMDKAERESAKWRRKVKKNIDDTTKSLKKMSKFATGGVVVAFAAVTRASIRQEDAFRQIEQRLESTGGVVGRTAEELDGLAAALQKTTTFGDEAINEMQGMLLTFTDIRGEVYERTLPAILDLSVAMKQDLKSSAVQLGKALNDPIANLSALSRTGIQFSKEQKETIKTLVEMGDKAAAQNLILAELERQFGGAATAAADSFGGALKQVQNAFGDLLENPAGLEANKEALQELTAILQDPATVAAANEITGALIKGFRAAAEAIRETVGLMKFLGEATAAAIHGPAFDDIPRLEDAVASLRKEIAFYEESGQGASKGVQALREELEQMEGKLETARAIAAEFKNIEQSANGAATAVSNVAAPAGIAAPVAANDPVIGAASGASSQSTSRPDVARGASSQTGDNRFTVIEEQHQQHADNVVAIETAKNAAILDGTASLFGSLTSATGQFAGEQSGLYKAMFAIEKGAAIARSIIAIQTGIAQASANPWPANLAAMASVAAATASIVSTIASTQIQGQAHDGLMSVPKTGTYLLEQGERVVSAETTKKMDKKLDNAGGGIRIVNSFDSADVVGGYIGSSAGEKAVMNIVNRNARTIRSLSA